MRLIDRIVDRSAEGAEGAAAELYDLGGSVWAMILRAPTPRPADVWTDLVRGVCERARGNARRIEHRLVFRAGADTRREALQAAGFQKEGERIEYRARIADLPDDAGSPIHWRTPAQLEEVVDAYHHVTVGMPGYRADEDVLESTRVLLEDSELTGGLQCAAIGEIDGKLAALVMAQVMLAPNEEGEMWSRITHMGLAPEFRGRALGKWVHRHGFAMMRAQGGTLYHGGTDALNIPMQRLFLSHGCSVYERMEEWALILEP